MDKPNIKRRFLKIAALGSALVGGLRLVKLPARRRQQPASQGWVIDQSKCRLWFAPYLPGAQRRLTDISWNRVLDSGKVGEKQVFLPRPCMHCEHAPCVEVCMVGASYKRPDGIVMMDYDKCIGCRYCEIACPYNARAFNWEAFTGPNPAVPEWGQPEVERRPRGVVEKCSFCYQRIDRGLQLGLTPGIDEAATPACVVACPAGARLFGDLNDPESPLSKALATQAYFRCGRPGNKTACITSGER
jgi:Fe-S-cluster-containing dehydrogenase component